MEEHLWERGGRIGEERGGEKGRGGGAGRPRRWRGVFLQKILDKRSPGCRKVERSAGGSEESIAKGWGRNPGRLGKGQWRRYERWGGGGQSVGKSGL